MNRVNYIFTACFMSPLLQALSSGQLLQHVLHFLFHSIVHLLLPSPDQPQPSSYGSEAGLSHHKGQVRCDKVSANGASSVPNTPKFQSGQRAVKKMLHTTHLILCTGWFFNCSAQISVLKKRCLSNEDLLHIENFMEQNLWLVAHRFHFGNESWEEQLKNTL